MIVFGPFLPACRRTEFERRAGRLGRVATLAFHEPLESLMGQAAAVVSPGGYNTFCEALSLGKRALIVPDGKASLERVVRARAAHRRGLAQMLGPGRLDPTTVAGALAQLSRRPAPATSCIGEVLGGLTRILATVAAWRAMDECRASDAGNRALSSRSPWISGRLSSARLGPRRPAGVLRP